MNIITGQDPIWKTDEYDVVLVGTSIYCMLTNGFQSKIRFKYPEIDKANNSTNYGDSRKLGKRLTIDGTPTISLLYVTKFPNSRRVFIDYDALEHTLSTANAEFKGKKVMTTLIGTTQFDGNGDREKCLSIIEKCTSDLDIDIYDYEQLPRLKEIEYNIDKLRKLRNSDEEKYMELWKNKENVLRKLYLC